MATTTRTRSIAPLALLLGALLLALPALSARADKAHNGRGKVTTISATSITVTPKNGDAKTFTINDKTVVTLDGQTVAAPYTSFQDTRATVKSDDGTVALTVKARTHKAKPADPAPAPTPAPTTP